MALLQGSIYGHLSADSVNRELTVLAALAMLEASMPTMHFHHGLARITSVTVHAVIDDPEDHVFYPDNPLWDGVGCDESVTTCCQFNNPPWFCKLLPQPTLDDIEIRLCADNYNERTPVELIEIYVR